VFFLPADDLAIVALSNGDMKYEHELAVVFRIIEDYLGLERKESERIIAELRKDNLTTRETTRSSSSGEEIKAKSSLSMLLHAYTGQYYDPGYGNLTLCAPSSHPPAQCADVLAAWSVFENVTDSSSQVLYAATSSNWVSHLRLSHKDSDTFNLQGTYLFPHGYGRDKSPFQRPDDDGDMATIEFVVGNGVASGGNPGAVTAVIGAAVNGLVGEVTESQRIGGSIQTTAEIWFEKIL
jgi:hypothetical protein